MPLYEWRCVACEGVFEVLTSAGAAIRRRPCPSCGAKSERVISSFAIHSGSAIATASEKAAAAQTDVTKLKLPNFARLCGMDDYSATRLAAHKIGRGAEFDDTVAAREQERAAKGESLPKPSSVRKPKHSHSKHSRS